MGKPKLIIVTGRPAAGKTTLAKWLAKELGLPLISKDSLRETLFDQLGWQDRLWAQKLGRASVELMFHFAQAQLQAGRSLILDNTFDPTVSTPRFQDLKSQYQADIIQIICNSDRETLFQRFVTRARSGERHPGHGDEAVLDELRAHLSQEHSPVLEIEGTIINVDTTDLATLDYQAILDQVKPLVEVLDNNRV